jgi:cyclic 2,3-diphosphoglycerate synthase
MGWMADGPVIALIDGEHHPPVVRAALDRVEAERGLAAVVLCGGEEKIGPEVLAEPVRHYGRALAPGDTPDEALRAAAGNGAPAAVLDLADEPALSAVARAEMASLAVHLGLAYEAPGAKLAPPTYAPSNFEETVLAVIGTGKRTGKTALAGHWAALLRDRDPVIVCMGRGGPAEPQLAEAGVGLLELLALAREGRHAASDYLEGAALAGVPTVGCRRVGGGPAGEPAESNVPDGIGLAAALRPGVLILEGSGACVPPVEADRTVCLVGREVTGFDRVRTLRADLCLLTRDVRVEGPSLRCELRPEPAEPVPEGARVALFTTGVEACEGVEPAVVSTNLAHRGELSEDLDRAAAEGCEVYLTELKAAAIDTVATRAQETGAQVIFVRNRPVGLDHDLDAALLELAGDG